MVAVDAFELLQDSEQRWSVEVGAALRCDGSSDSQHRRRLVSQALRAYERLRDREAPHADPVTVFQRWPACTLVALTTLAAPAAGREDLRKRLAQFLAEDHETGAATTGDTPPSSVGVDGRVDAWLHAWSWCWNSTFGSSGPLQADRPEYRDVPGLPLLLAATGLLGGAGGTPELRLDIHSGSLFLALPAGAARPWTVHADGVRYQVSRERWPVPRRALALDCFDILGVAHRIPLVDPADPLLIFDADGVLVPRDELLPAKGVWLLHAGEPSERSFDGSWRVLEEATPPPGWEQWWLGRVSLDSAARLRSYVVSQNGADIVGPWRAMAGSSAAELKLEQAIEGLLDLDGAPVYATAPQLLLPLTGDGTWIVEVSKAEDNVPLRRETVPGGYAVGLANYLPDPALGRFQVQASQAGKRSLRRTFTVAEGVAVHAEPRLRMLTETGTLFSANVDLTVFQSQIMVWPHTVHLGRRQISVTVDLRTDGPDAAALRLRVELPHTAVRKRTATTTGPWGITPLDFTPDELAGGASLDLRLPAAAVAAWGAVPTLAAGYELGNAAQVLAGVATRTAEVFRYNLAKLTDTARRLGDLRLWLNMAGQEAVVASVRDAMPASAALPGNDWIRLVDRRSGGRLEAAVHSVLAPWVPPQITELADGEDLVVLEPPFRQGGPLLITVRPVDLAESRRGDWPYIGVAGRTREGEVVFPVQMAGQVTILASPVEQSVANYLAAREELPEDPAALPLLWVVAARSGALPDRAVGIAIAQECAARLGADPAASLFAAATSGLSPQELVVPLIRSGLAAHRFREVLGLERLPAVWAAAPLAALLLTSPLLPYLSGGRHWDRAELDPAENVLLDEVGRRCGQVSLDLLAGRPLPMPGDSGFGPHTEHMERTPRAQLDEIVRQLALVPGWPLDPDSRFLAKLQAFAARNALRKLPYDLAEYLELVQVYAASSDHPALLTAMEAREVPEKIGRDTQWRLVPTLSLGFAFLARQAAQRNRAAIALERQVRMVWTHIAEHAPELTVQDIQLAEFLVSGHQTRDDQ